MDKKTEVKHGTEGLYTVSSAGEAWPLNRSKD